MDTQIKINPIAKSQLKNYLSIKDLTSDKSNHAIKLLYEKIRNHISLLHQDSKIKIYRLNPIVDVRDNYDNLLISKNNISRSSTYTHYVTKTQILRTHTSAHIPKILKKLAHRDNWDDIVILIPGLVYRRDVTDKKHIGIIHHMDMWRITKKPKKIIQKQDLLNVVTEISKICAPDWKLRIVDNPHPYTNEGIEVNLVKNDQDIEILECGLIKEQIMINAGLDPDKYNGWALGMGLDRLVMTLKNLPDIRYLRSTNPEIAEQMKDLSIYREVSHQPSISRDISYCVPKEYVEEDINEEIRNAIEKYSDSLESIAVLDEIKHEDLNNIAKERLGSNPKLKNILVRITLRHLSKTLTKDEANQIYKLIYLKVNYGKNCYEI